MFNLNLLSLILPVMFNPVSTYRIQFHAGFTFHDLLKLIPYLHELGVKTIYASPIFSAVPGSMHGYDGVDPNQINPEIGSLGELKAIAKELSALGMSWIQDIVPNHMAYDHHNAWLMDVLKKGEESVYRNYFDIISADLNAEPLMAPFLGTDLDEVIEQGKLTLVKTKTEAFLKYEERLWPLREGTDLKAPIHEIAKQQYYRLCAYTESNVRMNYRRFFTVNGLICLNMQCKETFDHYHQLIKDLIDLGLFQGLRIDHVDGLFDPKGYLSQLRELCGKETYIVVEKILEPDEVLPLDWPIEGTTGYDYLGLANQLYTNEKAENQFDRFYGKLTGQTPAIETQIRKKKSEFLDAYMQGELENLFRLLLKAVAESDHRLKSIYFPVFKRIIAEFLIHCPVYRFYGNQYPLDAKELTGLEKIFESLDLAIEDKAPLEVIKTILLQENIELYQRLMQFSGPLMAKGVEDTLMYTYNRHIGNNEVGDSPLLFGIKANDFHNSILSRTEFWPFVMNTSATHDTKRGEDVRARLSVLTDLKEIWIQQVKQWGNINQSLKSPNLPDDNDTYFIYQTLVSTYDEAEASQVYADRLKAYLQKALREAKENSEWEHPDESYESLVMEFLESILEPDGEFFITFLPFFRKVSRLARLKSLSSLVLKHGVPGVPDTYQGTELWDFSMVDPDNRRPVDYALRMGYLQEFQKHPVNLTTLLESGSDGKIKLFFLQRMLKFRAEFPDLFSTGLYVPLAITGKHADNFIAFARRFQLHWAVFIVPINPVAFIKDMEDLDFEYGDTKVKLPPGMPSCCVEILSQREVKVDGSELSLMDLFENLPFAVLYGRQVNNDRGAGILMHVTALPSIFGIGDIGPTAFDFLEFLASSGQKYWQMLPLNPVLASQFYSPYATSSVMAANPMLISPEQMVKDGLLSEADLKGLLQKSKKKVNFELVFQRKAVLLNLAYDRFKLKPETDQREFYEFSLKESTWLEDYALYEVIKFLNGGRPWFEWPEKLRLRNEKALAKVKQEHQHNLDQVRWCQFVFFKQWHRLRSRASVLNIKLIGDLPFYTSLDSADVWAEQSSFAIDRMGAAKAMAGVPPDHFSAEGQLWGMPVYNWDAMKRKGYRWWVDRLKKNLELYDLIRLDHFRAFSAYWEVPAGSNSAKFGCWKAGPGIALFEALSNQMGALPLIAEDLGDIDAPVLELRDRFNFPGMRVLHFAFMDDLANSVHAPHNFDTVNCVVYTGTHDNNTTKGWYGKDIDAHTRLQIADYVGLKVSKGNITAALIRMAYASVANVVIVPIQDVLNKGAKARMNVPASVSGNWIWRLKPGELNEDISDFLSHLVRLYGRN